MIAGKKVITRNMILDKISEYDIFKYYMNGNWEINVPTNSPFRNDRHPSFVIGNKYNKLTYIDFGNTKYKGDAFVFVKQLYNFSDIKEAYRKIDADFGITGGNKKYLSIVKKYDQPEIKYKDYSFIQVVTKKFNNQELEYWKSFNIGLDILKKNNVYSVKKIYLNRELITIKDELIFGYLYEDKWKIYRPLNKDYKWFPNNVPIDTMEGLENIKDVNVAFITKSKKDYMVLQQIMPNVCVVQNEGIACFSDNNVKYLKENSFKQILSFDSDPPGVENSLSITNIFGFDYCNVPKKYLKEGITDWADLSKAYGLKKVKEYLISKNIIT